MAHGDRGAPSRVRDDTSRTDGPDTDPDADPVSVARAICLQLLTTQPRTRAELAAALHRRGVPEEAAVTVLARLGEVGLVDDKAFAASWVQSRHVGRSLARRALAGELRRRGVDDGVVAEAVAVIDTDLELAAARSLVARRLALSTGLRVDTRVRRLVGMLARKGYSSGLALRVVREALDVEGIGDAGIGDVGGIGDADSDPDGYSCG